MTKEQNKTKTENADKICAAKLVNGKQCTRKAKPNTNVCGVHKNKIIVVRDECKLVYHCHLPGIFKDECEACKLKTR